MMPMIRFAAVVLAMMVIVPAWAATSSPAPEQPSPVVAVPADSLAQTTPSAGDMAIDALLVRPLSLAATAVGTALFLVSLPFSAISGNAGQAAHVLVVKPARVTFTRPLGHFGR